MLPLYLALERKQRKDSQNVYYLTRSIRHTAHNSLAAKSSNQLHHKEEVASRKRHLNMNKQTEKQGCLPVPHLPHGDWDVKTTVGLEENTSGI